MRRIPHTCRPKPLPVDHAGALRVIRPAQTRPFNFCKRQHGGLGASTGTRVAITSVLDTQPSGRPMTGPEHYAEAERLLALAGRHTRPFTPMASRFTKSALLAGRQAQIPDLPGAGKSRSGETADGPCLRVAVTECSACLGAAMLAVHRRFWLAPSGAMCVRTSGRAGVPTAGCRPAR